MICQKERSVVEKKGFKHQLQKKQMAWNAMAGVDNYRLFHDIKYNSYYESQGLGVAKASA